MFDNTVVKRKIPILLSDSLTKFTKEVLSIKRKQVFPQTFLWEKLNIFFRHGIQFLVKYCVFCMNSNGTRYSGTPYIYSVHTCTFTIYYHTYIHYPSGSAFMYGMGCAC